MILPISLCHTPNVCAESTQHIQVAQLSATSDRDVKSGVKTPLQRSDCTRSKCKCASAVCYLNLLFFSAILSIIIALFFLKFAFYVQLGWLEERFHNYNFSSLATEWHWECVCLRCMGYSTEYSMYLRVNKLQNIGATHYVHEALLELRSGTRARENPT